MTKIEIQAANLKCIFFFEEGLVKVTWLFGELNPLIAFVYRRRGGVLKWIQ